MTLLEIIISFAILGITMAVIGNTARVAFQNARLARDLVQAELLADRFLTNVLLGITEMVSTDYIPVRIDLDQWDIIEDTNALPEENYGDVLWHYKIEVDYPIDYEHLAVIAVEVRQNVPDGRLPIVCRLVRWLALEPEGADAGID
jgi:type II secretory pathway pseudopilin PulG